MPPIGDPGGGRADTEEYNKTEPMAFITSRGRQFKVPLRCLTRHPSSRLARDAMAARERGSETQNIELEYFRNSSILEVILDYYHEGQLHFPDGVCWRTFEAELRYWHLGAEQLSTCCKERYLAAGAVQRTLWRLQRNWERHMGRRLQDLSNGKPTSNIGRRMWYFFEDPDSSNYARVGVFNNRTYPQWEIRSCHRQQTNWP